MLNLFANLASVAISMIVGLWFTPFLLRNLGPSAYGLIPLATTIVSYFSLLTQTAGSSISRHLSVAVHSDDPRDAPRLFQSSMRMCIALSLILIPPLAILSYAAPWLIDTPLAMKGDTRWLFAAVSLGFLLSVVSTPFQSVLFREGRIYVSALAAIVQTLVRVAVAVMLFWLLSPRVSYVAFGVLAGASLSTLLCAIVMVRVAPYLIKGHFRAESRFMREVLGTASGLVLTQIGTVLLLSTDILLVNLWFGAHPAGEYAAVLQLALIMRVAGINIAVVFSPGILDLHARRDLDLMIAATHRAMKVLGLIMALPVGLICGSGGALLALWLGRDFGHFGTMLAVMVGPMMLNTSILPLFSVSLAANKTHLPGVVTLVTGFGHVGLSWILAVWCGMGPIGVAVAAVSMLSLKNILFTPLYAAANIDKPLGLFVWPLIPQALVALVITGVVRVVFVTWPPHNLYGAGVIFACISGIYLLVSPILAGREDRAFLMQKIAPVRRKLGWT